MNNYVERLSTEWNTHGKIVIAVDFDDTLHPWKFASVNPNVVRIIKDAKRIGAYIVIWTACDEARYPEIRHVCSSLGLEIEDCFFSLQDPFKPINKKLNIKIIFFIALQFWCFLYRVK